MEQLRLLHGRVRDSTIVVNSLSPQMSVLVEDAIVVNATMHCVHHTCIYVCMCMYVYVYIYIA